MAETLRLFSAKAEQAIAEEMRKTGLTREQILEQAAAEEPAALPPPANAARRRMVAAGVPELHVRHLADGEPIECDALRLVREHMQRRGGFLVLSGGKGVRKTGSACWMLGQVEDGVYVEALDLLDIAFHDRALFLRLRRAKYVVLDDIGAETTASGGADAALFQRELWKLWKGWYDSAATVVVTCNLERVDFDGRKLDGSVDPSRGYGERIRERMDERGRFYTVGGESVRRGMRQHWLDDKEE